MRTLSDIKTTANLYLDEAEICATSTPKVLGLAAMTTTLSCVVAVGEALLKPTTRPSDRQAIEAFCKKMTAFNWLLSRTGVTPEQDDIVEILWSVRNALIHALSLPNNVYLVPAAEDYDCEGGFDYAIVPSLFVEAVRKAMKIVHRQHADLPFDRESAKKKRSPVRIRSSGSTASDSESSERLR